jgi:hypothetical protein
LERVLGRGSDAVVYEATQLSLDRRVALKVMRDRALAERVRRLSWPDHPGAVSLFGVGDSEHGPWLAMRLVSGGTLEARRARLDEVAAALVQAHAAGTVHGRVTARNVLVDEAGRAQLSDFGLSDAGATATEDRAALAALVRERSPHRVPSRGVLVAAGCAALAGTALAVVLALPRDGSAEAESKRPPVPPGARAIGSTLAPGGVESVDCDGRSPSGTSLACTISQRELGGRPVVVPADGTVTSWAVRGARGPLALQILRGRNGRLVQVGKSREVTVPGPEPYVARSDLAVAEGDRIALDVAPTAAVGFRRVGRGALTDRWFGPLFEPARPPERPAGTGLDGELLLRVDIAPRAGGALIPLRGERAANAPSGTRLAYRTVAVAGGGVRTVTCVLLGAGVAIDLLDDGRRLARAPVGAAHGRGRLVALSAARGVVRVRWRNPDGRVIARRFSVTPGALR